MIWTPWQGFCTIGDEKIEIFTSESTEKLAHTALVYVIINYVLQPGQEALLKVKFLSNGTLNTMQFYKK